MRAVHEARRAGDLMGPPPPNAIPTETLEALVDAAARLHDARTSEASLQCLAREARKLFDADLSLSVAGHETAFATAIAAAPVDVATEPPRFSDLTKMATKLLADESSLRIDGRAGGATQLRELAAEAAHVDLAISWLGVPLLDRAGAHFGAIHVARVKAPFSPADVALLTALAHTASVAVDNARVFGAADRAANARDEVLSTVAHDLRNPLNNVALSASLLGDHLEERGDEEPRKLVARITGGVARMNHLIESLLEISRIESGKLQIQPRPERALALVTDALKAASARADEKGCHLEIGPIAEDLQVNADRARVLQIFSHLLDTAFRFVSTGASLVVSAARNGPRAEFTIREEGPATEPGEPSGVFERLGESIAPPRDGAALAVFIARGILEAHGGSLDVGSSGGVAVRFTLPLVAA